MTGHTDWRAKRYAAKSPAWLAGYKAYSPWDRFVSAPWAAKEYFDFYRGWEAAEFDYDEARDRAREDRQHYPLSPMSALERNRP